MQASHLWHMEDPMFSKNTGRVPDFPSSCYDVCKMLFSTFRHYLSNFKVLQIINMVSYSLYVSLLYFMVPCDVTTAPGKRPQPCITLWFFTVYVYSVSPKTVFCAETPCISFFYIWGICLLFQFLFLEGKKRELNEIVINENLLLKKYSIILSSIGNLINNLKIMKLKLHTHQLFVNRS